MSNELETTILRIGHRRFRDKRISTHLGLTARAFGAKRIVYSGETDKELLESVNSVTISFGGSFKADYISRPQKLINNWGGIVVHLTMYGMEIDDFLSSFKKQNETKQTNSKILVVVGGTKVPPFVYKKATYNVAVGSQPHSEVAALAVFLEKIYDGQARKREFSNAQIQITPSKDGKKVRWLNGKKKEVEEL